MTKVLIFDLETSPCQALVWGVWKQNIPAKMLDQTWNILSYSAKWLGSDDIYYSDLRHDWDSNYTDDNVLLAELYELVSQADVLVAHNGDRFDIPRLNTRFIRAGFSPIQRVQSVDTCKIARRVFDFEHNSLEYLTTQLLPEEYHKRKSQKFPGIDLWLECLSGNLEAWDEMQDYNEQDVIALEALYLKLRAWDDRHPVMPNFNE
ncbi:MAG: ribonuclease H-like domain-containing protein, partial [Bacteroides sp.]